MQMSVGKAESTAQPISIRVEACGFPQFFVTRLCTFDNLLTAFPRRRGRSRTYARMREETGADARVHGYARRDPNSYAAMDRGRDGLQLGCRSRARAGARVGGGFDSVEH